MENDVVLNQINAKVQKNEVFQDGRHKAILTLWLYIRLSYRQNMDLLNFI